MFEEDPPRHDAEGVIGRINALAGAVRGMGGKVIFVQHDGVRDEGLEPGTDGWKILPELERTEKDLLDRKKDQMTTSVLWRRIDTPGHDACRIRRIDDDWALEGTAVFLVDNAVARVGYTAVCGASWQSRRGRAQGWVGEKQLDLDVVRTDEGIWLLNGAAVPGLEACVDLDFGFTPATNFFQIRRIALSEGESADVPAAWLNVPDATLELLPQRYERRSRLTYWYEAPTAGYAGLLELSEEGFIRRYPGLWEMEW